MKSLIVACTQDKSKISAPMLPIIVKKSANGAVDDFIEPLEDGVKDGVGNLCAEILNGISNGIADAGEYISQASQT